MTVNLALEEKQLLSELQLTAVAGALAGVLEQELAQRREDQHDARSTRPLVVFLEGALGAGKTTFVRALLGEAGVTDRVKSPTYSIVESYDTNFGAAHHFDFYRVESEVELEFIALRDLLESAALLLVEWPRIAAAHLPGPDYLVELEHAGEQREVTVHSAIGGNLFHLS